MIDGKVSGSAGARSRDAGQPWWSLRISTGITARVWFPLLARHRFRVSPSRIHLALLGSMVSLVTFFPAVVQRLRFRRRVAEQLLPPPVFIIGHWRSGTTFLHELLATDRRFVTPSYLHTFATDHFLAWESPLRLFDLLMPARRPMDNIPVGWDRPQEDEFALLATGAPSPYEAILFPNDRGPSLPNLAVETMPDAVRTKWESALRTALQRVVFDRARRSPMQPAEWLLLKSPTHTARIAVLSRMFPDARFIHVVRDPFALAPSTEHLWRRMFATQALQRPRYDGALALDRFVTATALEMYRNFDRDVAALPQGRFAETRYEDLVRDPVGEVARIRAAIGLPGGDADALGGHLAEVGEYRRNRFDLEPAKIEAIRRDWAWYFERFGYADTAQS